MYRDSGQLEQLRLFLAERVAQLREEIKEKMEKKSGNAREKKSFQEFRVSTRTQRAAERLA
jgi:hypothetical protein